MILPFDDKYRIKSTPRQWTIQHRRPRNGKLVWESFKFFARLDFCLRELGEMLVRELDTEGLPEAIQAVDDLCNRIARTFMPVLQIKTRIGPEETGSEPPMTVRLR